MHEPARIPTRRRVAHVISLDAHSSRYRNTWSLLRKIGFEVRRVQPIPLNDSRVIDWESRFRRPTDPSVGSPRPSISLSLTHLRLWNEFPTDDEWLYIFEDDLMLQPSGHSALLKPYGRHDRRSGKHTQTWRWPDDDPERLARCLISEAESAANSTEVFRATPMIYFGCSGFHHHRSAVVSLAERHTVRMCDCLCLHAYAIRRPFAARLAEQLFSRREWDAMGRGVGGNSSMHSMYRYNLDVMLRGFFGSGMWNPPEYTTRGVAPDGWPRPLTISPDYNITSDWKLLQPLCVDMEEGGIFTQNLSLATTVSHTFSGVLAW